MTNRAKKNGIAVVIPQEYEATKVFFAAPIPQEYATSVAEVANEYGVKKIAFSAIGCRMGKIGVYAEFDDKAEKETFKDAIGEVIGDVFDSKKAWCA